MLRKLTLSSVFSPVPTSIFVTADTGCGFQILQESKQESEADEIEEEVDEIVVEAEFTAQQFWLLIIFVLGGTVVIMAALRGIFQGFGALEVCAARGAVQMPLFPLHASLKSLVSYIFATSHSEIVCDRLTHGESSITLAVTLMRMSQGWYIPRTHVHLWSIATRLYQYALCTRWPTLLMLATVASTSLQRLLRAVQPLPIVRSF